MAERTVLASALIFPSNAMNRASVRATGIRTVFTEVASEDFFTRYHGWAFDKIKSGWQQKDRFKYHAPLEFLLADSKWCKKTFRVDLRRDMRQLARDVEARKILWHNGLLAAMEVKALAAARRRILAAEKAVTEEWRKVDASLSF